MSCEKLKRSLENDEAVILSPYQNLKLWVLPIIGLSKDAVHIYIGFACFLLSVTLLRRPLSSYSALILGLVVASGMEILDLRDDLNTLGHLRWGASLHDIINTNAIPFMLVVLFRLWLQGSPSERRRNQS